VLQTSNALARAGGICPAASRGVAKTDRSEESLSGQSARRSLPSLALSLLDLARVRAHELPEQVPFDYTKLL
jgi:hypothetical protein